MLLKLASNKYRIQTQLSLDEVFNVLDKATLKKDNLVMVHTSKEFIGRINSRDFSIVSASLFPFGPACVVKGELQMPNNIIIYTKLHIAFRILLYGWLIALTGLSVYLAIDSGQLDQILFYLGFVLIGYGFFRLYLQVVFIFARKRTLKKLNYLLGLEQGTT